MPCSGRKRASLLLLLVLAAGLVAAGAGAAASAQEMPCCPDGMGEQVGCTWLGAADCCTATPSAPPSPTPSAPAACGATLLPALHAAPAVLPSCALAPPNAHAALRTTVLRL